LRLDADSTAVNVEECFFDSFVVLIQRVLFYEDDQWDRCLPQQNAPNKSVHTDRTACGNRDHCDPDCPVIACRAAGS
jgi:hypothetical protein